MRDVLGVPCRQSSPGLQRMAERSCVSSPSEAYLAPRLFKLGSSTHGKVQTLVSPDVPSRIRAGRTGETLASLIQDADRSNLGRRAPRQGTDASHKQAPRTGHARRAAGFPQGHIHGSGAADGARAAIGGTHGVRPRVRRALWCPGGEENDDGVPRVACRRQEPGPRAVEMWPQPLSVPGRAQHVVRTHRAPRYRRRRQPRGCGARARAGDQAADGECVRGGPGAVARRSSC